MLHFLGTDCEREKKTTLLPASPNPICAFIHTCTICTKPYAVWQVAVGGGGEKIWNWCVPSWACKQAIACAIRENICKSVDAESLCTVEKSEEHESRTCGSRRRRVSSINPHARTTEKGKCLTQLLNPQLTITGTGKNRQGPALCSTSRRICRRYTHERARMDVDPM